MPFSRDKLKNVTTIVTHANCPDGVASALVLKHALSRAKVIFLSYGTDDFMNLPATPGMLFCDISPPPTRVEEFVRVGAIVLDHHRSARAVVDAFGDNGVFADEKEEPGVSGAMLAYANVWVALRPNAPVDMLQESVVREFARLVGIRDTFQRKSGDWATACALSEVLKFFSANALLENPIYFFDTVFSQHLVLGMTLYDKRIATARRERDRAYRVDILDNMNVAIVPTLNTTDIADVFDEDVLDAVPDVIVGFGYFVEKDVVKLSLSLRSHKDFDCSAFAKHYGGGGHVKAAGCTFTVIELDVQPFTYIVDKIVEFIDPTAVL